MWKYLRKIPKQWLETQTYGRHGITRMMDDNLACMQTYSSRKLVHNAMMMNCKIVEIFCINPAPPVELLKVYFFLFQRFHFTIYIFIPPQALKRLFISTYVEI